MKHLLVLSAVFTLFATGAPATDPLIEELAVELELLQESNPTPDPACAQKCSTSFSQATGQCKKSTGQESFKCLLAGLMEFVKCARACSSH